jgi:hypothetical protein
VPFVVRLDGTNDEEGRPPAGRGGPAGLHVEATMLDAAERVVELAKSGSKVGGVGMSILIDNGHAPCVSGITGREGTFHATNNKRYGTTSCRA